MQITIALLIYVVVSLIASVREREEARVIAACKANRNLVSY